MLSKPSKVHFPIIAYALTDETTISRVVVLSRWDHWFVVFKMTEAENSEIPENIDEVFVAAVDIVHTLPKEGLERLWKYSHWIFRPVIRTEYRKTEVLFPVQTSNRRTLQ